MAYITVLTKAEWDIYNDFAVSAIRLASPFPAVPTDLMAKAKPGSAGIRILAAFNYVLDERGGNQ